jgi:hypothetical protein
MYKLYITVGMCVLSKVVEFKKHNVSGFSFVLLTKTSKKNNKFSRIFCCFI